MASNQSLARKAQALLARWPADPLRPTAHLGTVLSARLSQHPPPPPKSPSSSPPEAQVRAVAALLDDAFARRYAVRPARSATGEGLMRPRGSPGYYEALIRDLEELPTRTWWDRVRIRAVGMFRWT